MRVCLLFLTAFCLSACASAPPVRRSGLTAPVDAAEGLKRYYQERLAPSPDGYVHQGTAYGPAALPVFYDAQGAKISAQWARQANGFAWCGDGAGLFILGAGIGISAMAPSGDPAKNAWWLSLLPAGLITWTFHWVGDGWFRRPSVALYNKRLAEHLGLRVEAVQELP